MEIARTALSCPRLFIESLFGLFWLLALCAYGLTVSFIQNLTHHNFALFTDAQNFQLFLCASPALSILFSFRRLVAVP